MPIDPETVEQFLGHPGSGTRTVLVRTDSLGSARHFDGDSIPLDGRTYIAHGTTFLADGTTVQSRFEIDTRRPVSLVGSLWYIDGKWYKPFEPAALAVLGVTREAASPTSWMTNVRLRSLDDPPYLEGQVVRRVPWWRRWMSPSWGDYQWDEEIDPRSKSV
jgi:hypothetical protein